MPAPGPKTTATQNTPLWQWAAGICAAGWLLTGLLWWRQRRVKPRPQSTPPPTPVQKAASGKSAVIKAAQSNNARASYDALCLWGQQLAGGRSTGADYWQSVDDMGLRQEVAHLQRCLYAAEHGNWQGTALIEAVQQWTPETQGKASATLPSFYPHNRA